MLRFLSITNFALIDHLEIEFQSGFNLITGETGSGKSILVDAVGQLVGERASQEMVRQGCDRAQVEGIFSLAARNPARNQLRESGIHLEGEELVVRREIALSGTNKIFLNGTLVPQRFLSEIGTYLADIHGQHEQQHLLLPRTHLEFLDAFGENQQPLNQVARLFRELKEVRSTLDRMRQSEQERLRQLDSFNFQIQDIERLQLRTGLREELEQERQLLSSAERRHQSGQEAYQLLYEREDSLLALFDRLEKELGTLGELDGMFQEALGRLRESRYQLEELAYQIRDYATHIEFNPARLEATEERLAEIQQAARKYGRSVEEILAYEQKIRQEAGQLAAGEEQIEELGAREEKLRTEYLGKARQLSQKRRQDALALCRSVEGELKDLAMEHTVFSAQFRSEPTQPTEQGIDSVEFFLSPNPGEAPGPLAKIASGGELSRVVLALKSILTLEDYPKTLVFDEVDAGIGARVAATLGKKLAKLATQHQVFCVTHLPQIASHAAQHFHVEKRLRGKRTLIQITPLESRARVEELARMMAGDRISETTRRQARELLRNSGAVRAV